MISQRTTALLVFVFVLVIGSVAAIRLTRTIRERRLQRLGDDPATFLSDYSRADSTKSIAGAPGVAFRQDGEMSYAPDSVVDVKLFLVNRNSPNVHLVRRILEDAPYRVFRTAVQRMEAKAEGLVTIDGRHFIVRAVRLDEGSPKADLLDAAGSKVGTIQLRVESENVVQGTIELTQQDRIVTYDVFIARNHPNASNLYQAARAAGPMSRAQALVIVKNSYNATARGMAGVG